MKLNINWKAVLEAVKEPVRWFILYVAAFAITTLINQIPAIADFLFQTLGLTHVIWTTGLTAVLRAVDKYIYKLQSDRVTLTGETRTFYGLTQI